MNDHLFQILIPITGLVSGLIATYVSLQNRALLAEVRRLAELENRIIARGSANSGSSWSTKDLRQSWRT